MESNHEPGITIGKTVYLFKKKSGDRGPIQAFIKKMQFELPQRKYPLTLRLYKIAAYAVGDEGVRGIRETDAAAAMELRGTYDDWDQFVDQLAAGDLIAARLDTYVTFRPRRLGVRPSWFAHINAARPSGEGQAIRHIVPSHLLGYVAEKIPLGQLSDMRQLEKSAQQAHAKYQDIWKPKINRLPDLSSAGFDRTSWPKSEWQLKRRVWELLYNHPGNLWVGESYANSVIGLMQGAVQAIIRRFKPERPSSSAAVTPSRPTQALREALPTIVGSAPTNLRDEIMDVLGGVVTTLINEDASIDDITEFCEDVAANLDLDTPEYVDWNTVVGWQRRFEEAEKVKAGDLISFLGGEFKGSLLAPTTD